MTKLSQAQLVLPQFLPLDVTEVLRNDTLSDNKRLDRLRDRINEHVWTGEANDYSGLVSLMHIL